jgi:hypothetical protein
MNVTLYLHESRYRTRSHRYAYSKRISIPVEEIVRVDHRSNISCFVVVRAYYRGGIMQGPGWHEERHIVAGNAYFIRWHISRLAIRHGVPVRLQLIRQNP